jgi:hypothetical protein
MGRPQALPQQVIPGQGQRPMWAEFSDGSQIEPGEEQTISKVI